MDRAIRKPLGSVFEAGRGRHRRVYEVAAAVVSGNAKHARDLRGTDVIVAAAGLAMEIARQLKPESTPPQPPSSLRRFAPSAPKASLPEPVLATMFEGSELAAGAFGTAKMEQDDATDAGTDACDAPPRLDAEARGNGDVDEENVPGIEAQEPDPGPRLGERSDGGNRPTTVSRKRAAGTPVVLRC